MAQSRGRGTRSWRLEGQRRKQIPRPRLGMTRWSSAKGEQVREVTRGCRVEFYLSY
jgi:hypothetical protein